MSIRRARAPAARAVPGLGLGLGLAGRAGSAPLPPRSAPLPPPSAPLPPPSAPAPASPAGACGSVAADVRQRPARPGVQGVTVERQCTTVVAATTLSDGDAQQARRLCEPASATAYTGGITDIVVLGGSRKELARGGNGSTCG